jgi:hypothetical protein
MMKTLVVVVSRGVAVFACVLFGVAVVVGRLVPAEPAEPIDPVVVSPSRPVMLSPCVFRGLKPGERWYLDPDTGATRSLRVPASQLIDHASFSPWRDARGGREVVGRWAHRLGPVEDPLVDRVGLIRMSFPEGRLLDLVETDRMPSSPPCWVPGLAETILYSARDGRLVRLNFSPDPAFNPRPRPESLGWSPDLGHLGRVVVGDPIWPSDRRFGGRLIVSLYRFTPDPADPFEASGIWWLQLDATASNVVAAGRITPRPPIDAEIPVVSQVAPAVAIAPDGTPLLAYLEQNVDTFRWRVHLASLRFDAGIPAVDRVSTIDLDLRARPDRPAFSSDGRWLTLGFPTNRPTPRLLRLDTDTFRHDPELARSAVERMGSEGEDEIAHDASATDPVRLPAPSRPAVTLTAPTRPDRIDRAIVRVN